MPRASRATVEKLIQDILAQKFSRVLNVKVKYDRRLGFLYRVSKSPGGIKVEFAVNPREKGKFLDAVERASKAVYEVHYGLTTATQVMGRAEEKVSKALVPLHECPQFWGIQRQEVRDWLRAMGNGREIG